MFIVECVFNESKIKIKTVGPDLTILKLTCLYIKAKDMSMDIIVNIESIYNIWLTHIIENGETN